jgi:hypothetical protein
VKDKEYRAAFGLKNYQIVEKELARGSRVCVYQVEFITVPCLLTVIFGHGRKCHLPKLMEDEDPPATLPEYYYEGPSKLLGELDFGRSYRNLNKVRVDSVAESREREEGVGGTDDRA